MTSPPPPAPASPSAPITDAIWVGVPLALRRFSGPLAVSTVDGLYLAAQPLLGLLTPLAALAAGLLAGVMQPGYTYVFTESLWLLLAIAAVGALSGALGSYLTAGFVIGDLFLAEHPQWSHFGTEEPLTILARYGSLLLSYALFAMLAVGVPIAAKSFAAEFSLPPSVPRAIRALVGLGALIGITALLVWVWTQSAPLLVRPVFTWSPRITPTVDAMITTQESGHLIVLTAVLATLLRAFVQLGLTRPTGPGPARMTFLEGRFRTQERVVPLMSRMPFVIRALLRAVVLTALLSGLYAAWWQAFLTFALLLAVQLVTGALARVSFGAYARFMQRIPRFFRLLLAMAVVYAVGAMVVPLFLDGQSFFPFLLLATLAAILTTLLTPAPRPEDRS